MSHIQLAFVEDDAGMRERIARVVAGDPELHLLLAATTGAQILSFLSEQAIDVLLVDLGLPDTPGLEVISHCRRVQPACAVMVLTIFGDETNMVKAFEAGASGYLLKDGTEADLATHIQHLRAGGSPMSPVIARQLLRKWQADGKQMQSQANPGVPPTSLPVSRHPSSGRSGMPLPERLSRREFEVLDLVSRGFTYSEVGTRIGVSVATVQTHIRNIYGKLDVHNKSEAVFEARNLGLLS